MRCQLTKANAGIWIVPLVGMAVYANSLAGAFHYDDFHSIVENVAIRSWSNALDFFVDTALFSADTGKAMYRPILLLSYALNYSLGGYDVLGYHVFNLALHLVASWLVMLIAGHLFGNRLVTLFSGLLFVVHPVASEPVNYISSRSESLMACFYLATFYFYMRDGERSRWWSLLFYLCALLSKSVALTVPIVLWCYDRWRGEINWRRLLPHMLLCVGYVAVLIANRFLENSLRAPVRALDVQVWTQVKAWVYYVKLLVFPRGLNVEHQFFESTSVGEPAVVGAGLLLLSLLYLIWLTRHRWSGFALICSGIVLLPATLMPLNMLVNERRLYLSLAAICWLMAVLWQRLPRPLFYAWVGVLAALGIQRNTVWENEMTLWADAVEKAPAMYRAQSNWGKALQEVGYREEALSAYQKAIDIDSRHGDAYNNIATIYHMQGEYERAISWYEKALIRYPDYEEIHQNLADAHVQRGDLPAALAAYKKALDKNPLRAEVWSNYGQALYVDGQLAEAETAFKRALELLDELAEPYNNLGNIYADRLEFERALAMYAEALSRSPRERGQILSNMADAYAALGQVGRARKALHDAIAHDPQAAAWPYELGRLERRLGQLDAALAAFADAARIDGNHKGVLVHWGEVLLEQNKSAGAAERFADATRVDPEYERAWYGLGRALKVQGEHRAARRAFQRFLSLWNREDARSNQVRVWLEQLEGDI